MIIMKFGGSSINDSERIDAVTEIIRKNLQMCPVVVFSAIGDVTDWLVGAGEKALRESTVNISMIKELHQKISRELDVNPEGVDELFDQLESLLTGISLIREISPRTKDFLLSFGERLSVRIISSYMNRKGIKSSYFDAWDVGIRTNSDFQGASVIPEAYNLIRDFFAPLKLEYGYTPVVTGFIGKDANGNITTLARGGSDLTASILGNALDAEEVQVWKDVDGLLTTDPRIVERAVIVPEISFEEASELAYFGARILHPLSIIPAMEKTIPVRVKNSYKPDLPGTVIKKTISDTSIVKAITFRNSIILIDIVSTRMLGLHGFLARVFQIFAHHGISVDMIASSEVSISLTCNKSEKDLDGLVTDLKDIAHVSVSIDKAMVTIVGDVKRSSEILSQVFNTLLKEDINVQMISQGASKVNVSLIINEKEVERVIRILHRAFFEPETLSEAPPQTDEPVV